MDKKFKRLGDLLEKQVQNIPDTSRKIPFSLKDSTGKERFFGGKNPKFSLKLNNGQAIAALSTMDQELITRAYLLGDIELEGEVMQVLYFRDLFSDKKGFNFAWRLIQPFLFGQVKSDKKWISQHYDLEEDFFLLFLDRKHRAYSQAVFAHANESLEEAETRKFEFALEAVKAKPGDRILEIGSGWGAFVEFAGQRGIEDTSLTISERSKNFVQGIIDDQKLPCNVLLEHFLHHDPDFKYDAIVNCGVTEHLPDFAGSLKQYQKLLRPGGYLYLDASADRIRNSHGTFMNKYVLREMDI